MKNHAVIIIGYLAVAFTLLGCAHTKSVAGDRRNWAEVTLVSEKTASWGGITAEFSTRHPPQVAIMSGHYVDGVYQSDNLFSCGGNSLYWRFIPGCAAIGLDLNPERSPVTGEFTNSPLYSRFLLHVGEKRRIYTGESVALYDFTASGKRYSYLLHVIPLP